MNIGHLLTKSARTFPEKMALVHGTKQVTYAQFNGRVNRLSNALARLGVRRGGHVAILMYNYPEMMEAMFACFKAGFAALPINFRLHPNEFAFIIDHAQAEAVIVSPEFNETILEIRDKIPNVRHIVSVSEATGKLIDYEAMLSCESQDFSEVEVDPSDVAWLFYTSGTTGQPKGAMLTHRNLLAMSMSFYADMCQGFGPEDVVLHAAPLSHGCGLYALPNIGKATTNVILESKSFDPPLVARTIETWGITNLFAAPTMIKQLIDSPAIDDHDLGSLRVVVYGGAPMLTEDLLVAIKKLGPCLVQLYGQGESPMTITYLPHRDHVLDGSPQQMKRLESAGIAHTDVEVKIVGSDDQELSAGEKGQIVTRSDLVMKGYWRNPEATAETLRNGWLHTGDIGYVDHQGYLFIMDRSKDMIISGGENIYPREIEEVIIQHQAVNEVAIVGVPDPKWGEAVKAVVSLVPGQTVTEEELIEFCRGHIASYKKPKSVDFVAEIPKSNYGKILKRELRAKYWEGKQKSVI